MKKQFFLIIIVLSISFTYGQYSNIEVFSPEGEAFTLLLDGVKQNDEPKTRVKGTGYFNDWCDIVVVFEDKKNGTVSRNLRILPAGNEFSIGIKKKKKGKYKLYKNGSFPILEGIPSYLIFEDFQQENNLIVTETTTTTTNTTTTYQEIVDTVTQEQANGASLNVDINEGNFNIDLDVNVGTANQPETQVSVVPSTNTETNTTTTTTVSEIEKPKDYYVPGYTGRVACSNPISDKEFNRLYTVIFRSKTYSYQIKQIEIYFDEKCLTTKQIFALSAGLGGMSVRFAKFAYLRVYDINNFDGIITKFESHSYKTEINNFILQNPR